MEKIVDIFLKSILYSLNSVKIFILVFIINKIMVYFLLVDKKYTETEKVDIDEILLDYDLTKYDNNGTLLNKEKAEELDYRWSMNSIEKLKKSFEKGFFNGIIYIITEFFLDFSYNILSLKNKTLLYDLHIIINFSVIEILRILLLKLNLKEFAIFYVDILYFMLLIAAFLSVIIVVILNNERIQIYNYYIMFMYGTSLIGFLILIIINYISNSTDITKQQQLLSMIRYGLILFPFGFLFTTISKIAGYINFIGRKNTKKQIQVFNDRID